MSSVSVNLSPERFSPSAFTPDSRYGPLENSSIVCFV